MTPQEKAAEAVKLLEEAAKEIDDAKGGLTTTGMARELGILGTGVNLVLRLLVKKPKVEVSREQLDLPAREAEPQQFDGTGKVDTAALPPKSGPCGAC